MKKITVILYFLQILFFTAGCSSVREEPKDEFAPRPENARSQSYRLVRLNEDKYSGKLDINNLLKKIASFRQQYQKVKTIEDFSYSYDKENEYKNYSKKLQSFKDSDLDAAEKYLKSLPPETEFSLLKTDEGKKYDIGDIDWTDSSRQLQITDFYAQYYSDDWSPYFFIINLIPTARNGYGKLQLSVNGENLIFRKKVRKKIWTFSSGYFWVHTKIYTTGSNSKTLPMIISIEDPNDHGDMNGAYLVIPL